MEGERKDPETPINEARFTASPGTSLDELRTLLSQASGILRIDYVPGGFRVLMDENQDPLTVQAAVTTALDTLAATNAADQAAIDETVTLLQQVLAKPKANRSPIENIVVGFGTSIPDIRKRTR